MKILKFSFKSKEIILNVDNVVYTIGNIMTIIDIYFENISSMNLPAKLRVIVSNENLDELLVLINDSNYIDLNKLGSYIESMKYYYKVSGYVDEKDKEVLESLLDIEPEDTLLEWSDTVANQEEMGEDSGTENIFMDVDYDEYFSDHTENTEIENEAQDGKTVKDN